MLHQRLLLHSPAFLLLAAANLLLLVKSIYSEPKTRALSLKDGLHAFHNASQSLLASEGPLDGTRRPDRHGASSASDLGDSFRSSQCASASPDASTQSCDVCVVDPSNELCRTYGIDNIHLSRAYEGSGHRMRKFFEKALRGEVVRIGIIGGSITVGHGVQPDEVWHVRWFKDFKKRFPLAEVQLAAIPSVGAEFFSWCYTGLIDDDLDLYIIELDVNNLGDQDDFRDDDALLRALLGQPNQPAVMRVSVIAIGVREMFDNQSIGFTSAITTANYFDIPIVSVRHFLLPHFLAHPDQIPQFFGVYEGEPDYRHMARLGHQALSDMLILYTEEKACETRRRLERPSPTAVAPWPRGDTLGGIPRLYQWEPYHPTFVAPAVRPQCAFLGSPRSPLKPLDPPFTTADAWKRVDWHDKSALVADKVGDIIAFAFTGNRVGIYLYHQSGRNKPPSEPKPGQMACWVDKALHDGVILDLYWSAPISLTVLNEVALNLTEGDHVLHCQITSETSTGGHEVRIMGVAST